VLYRWIRDLHLYFGLFISPFILLFSISVIFLNHAKVNPGAATSIETIRPIHVPQGIDTAQGPAAIVLAKDILSQTKIEGEIGFTRFVRSTNHFVFPVSKPGMEATVDVDTTERVATISRRTTGTLEALAYLHKMPGPHNANIRGNWIWTKVWRPFADATVYLTLFLSISGVYLWYVLKAERKIGVVLLAAGAVSFFGLIYAVIR
jgi:hypothetical protein